MNKILFILTLILFTSCASTPVAPAPPPTFNNILLIGIDSLRADHLGCYGYDYPTSPLIDRLASEGILFENAYTTQSLTTPAFTAMFTAKHPVTTGIRDLTQQWPENLESLISLIHDSDYYTIGSAAKMVTDGTLGFNRGFDIYYSATTDTNTARQLQDVRVSLNSLNLTDNPNVFVFFHMWDVHSPYNPSQDNYEKIFNGNPPPRTWTCSYETLYDLNEHNTMLDLELLTQIIGLYDGDILGAEEAIQQLLDMFDEAGRLDSTLVIIAADHGESLGERHLFSHGRATPYELHVPLIFHFPNHHNAGRRVSGLVEVTDILPTLLDLLDISEPHNLDGQSLAPLLLNETLPTEYRFRPYMLAVEGHGPGGFFIHDGDYPQEIDSVAVTTYTGDSVYTQLTAEQLEQLRALGYVN